MPEILTPQEMRARLVKSYTDSYRRAGLGLTEKQIEMQVLRDLELVDGARRAGDLGDGKRVKRDRVVDPVRDPVAAAARASGLKLAGDRAKDKTARPYRPRVLHNNPQTISERWGYATKRMERILQGAGGASSLTVSAGNAEVPRLAKKLLELFAFYHTMSKPPPARGIDHNPFRGLSDRDAARMFMRLCEDVCDQSTGVLGSWYVK